MFSSGATRGVCSHQGPLEEYVLTRGPQRVIFSTRTPRLWALVSASIESNFFKLPSQSQTNVEQKLKQLADDIKSLGLTKGILSISTPSQTRCLWAPMTMGSLLSRRGKPAEHGTFQEALWRAQNRG